MQMEEFAGLSIVHGGTSTNEGEKFKLGPIRGSYVKELTFKRFRVEILVGGSKIVAKCTDPMLYSTYTVHSYHRICFRSYFFMLTLHTYFTHTAKSLKINKLPSFCYG